MNDESMFEISSDIPLPKKTKYPFDQMKVGDSFFAAGQQSSNLKSLAKRAGINATSTNVTENGVKGARIWRIE